MRFETCPVCGWDMKDGGLKVKVGEREITVCCDECAAKAKEDPAKYAMAR